MTQRHFLQFSGIGVTVFSAFTGSHAGMIHVYALASAFFRDARGATAIEYGLVAALVSISIIAAATSIGQSVLDIFNKVAASM